VSEFGIDLKDIRVLSLGTTSDLGVRKDRLDRGGLLAWARAATPLILRGQSRAAENATYHLLPQGQFLRIDPKVPANVLRLDGVSPSELRGRAESEARQRSGDVRKTEEEGRSLFERLTEGQLAICDLLMRPAPELSEDETVQ
jgi:hypothetical protein